MTQISKREFKPSYLLEFVWLYLCKFLNDLSKIGPYKHHTNLFRVSFEEIASYYIENKHQKKLKLK
jgi:hypothetical protein